MQNGVGSILLLTAISISLAILAHAGRRAMVFGYSVNPVVLCILWLSMQTRSDRLENSKILSAISGMTYQFFLVQLFLWELSSWVLAQLERSGNIEKIGISFALCTLISYIVWRFYDKPIKKALSRWDRWRMQLFKAA
jgi:peptidoglycan/LPS O-acetylase OafA/YrhL